jgi:hypothetical protein
VLEQLRSGKIDDTITSVLSEAGKEVAKGFTA